MFCPRVLQHASIFAVSLLVACSSGFGTPKPNETHYAPGERIGTYDGRAVAVAFAHSDLHDRQLEALRAEHKAAKAAGDSEAVRKLEAEGQRRQDALHKQVFEGARIDDILVHIQSELPAIRANASVVRLDPANMKRPEHVQTVDVTDQLVQRFDPDEKALATISELRQHPLPPLR